ncbi:MAG: hypothetical protein JSR66_17270 [Proteobacteria bacterium]|nr:hypothetical protein [Pseudomonadota bacterium]
MKHPTTKLTIVSLAAAIPLAGVAGIQGSGRNFALIAPVTANLGDTLSVGGVPYSDSAASIEVDGQAGKSSQLEVGDVVTAYGNGNHIERLILNHSVRGPVSSVDPAGGTFTAAGQTIHVGAQTTLAVGLSALVPGTKVQVSGWADSTGDIIASRVDLLISREPTQVSGEVTSLDAGRHRFKINQLTVDYSASEVEGVLQEGADVVVDGVSFDRNGALVANEVQLVQPLQVTAGQTGRLEGIITQLTSTAEFEIDGQSVRVTASTKQNLHGGPIALNAKVKVSGVFDDNGVLVLGSLQSLRR